MGLAERRAVIEFETSHLPALKTRIDEAAGFAVPTEIHWDTLCPAGESRLYFESWTAIYFEPLIAALKNVSTGFWTGMILNTMLNSGRRGSNWGGGGGFGGGSGGGGGFGGFGGGDSGGGGSSGGW